MVNTPSMYVRDVLLGLATVSLPQDGDSWPVFVSSEPPLPDECVTIYDPEGIKSGGTLAGGNVFHYGIQVRVRSRSYQTGWTKTKEVCEFLNGILQQQSSDIVVQTIRQTSPIVAIGPEPDNQRREIFTANFLVMFDEGDG